MGAVETLSRGERDEIWSKLADPIDCDLNVHVHKFILHRVKIIEIYYGVKCTLPFEDRAVEMKQIVSLLVFSEDLPHV